MKTPTAAVIAKFAEARPAKDGTVKFPHTVSEIAALMGESATSNGIDVDADAFLEFLCTDPSSGSIDTGRHAAIRSKLEKVIKAAVAEALMPEVRAFEREYGVKIKS